MGSYSIHGRRAKNTIALFQQISEAYCVFVVANLPHTHQHCIAELFIFGLAYFTAAGSSQWVVRPY